mgnify:CR=1 FL=1
MSVNPEVYKWAKWVSEKIQVPAEIIYAQWSLEAGESGIQSPANKNYNLGGLTVSGTPGIWRKYSSLAEFASDYVYSFILPGYPKVVGAETIDEFVLGLKQGKWGSYFGSESVESYGGKLKSRYKYLGFPASPGSSVSSASDTAELRAAHKPKWKQDWDDFLIKLGFKHDFPEQPTPEEELRARQNIINEAKKKGEPIPEEFQQKTDILQKYVQSQQDEGIKGILNKVLIVVIGIACFIVGAILLTKDTVTGFVNLETLLKKEGA